MARTRSAGYDDQRDAILASAAELFANQGYVATSMNDIAAACGVSKAGLYHYYRDKRELLFQITVGHVARLEQFVAEVLAEEAAADPETRLRALILRFVREYADAQHEHRVLTEDVRFLEPDEHAQVTAAQRRVVAAFADTIAAVRPTLARNELDRPLAMLLFGMINWMFTWLRPDGSLTHEQMAPLVADLFFGGLGAVRKPRAAARPAVLGEAAENHDPLVHDRP
ncbi:MAG TPA: TetR/AcrR family transcriptional regulator [Burkholderiaceae bacterium]